MSCNNDPLRRENSSKFTPPLVVDTPSHRVAMERQPGMICIERIGMVRPAGWSGCGSSPTVFPSRRGGIIIGRLKGAAFESKLTSWGGAAAGPARSSRRKSTLLAVPSLLDEKEFLQQMRAGPLDRRFPLFVGLRCMLFHAPPEVPNFRVHCYFVSGNDSAATRFCRLLPRYGTCID